MISFFPSRLRAWVASLSRHLAQRRRMRQGLRELSQMSPTELRDLGLSHAGSAVPPRSFACCR